MSESNVPTPNPQHLALIERLVPTHIQHQADAREATLAWLTARETFDNLQREVMLTRLRGEVVSDDLGMRSLRSLHALHDTQATMDDAHQRVSENTGTLGRVVVALRDGGDPMPLLSRWRVRVQAPGVEVATMAWVLNKDANTAQNDPKE